MLWCFSVNPLYLKTILSQMICYAPPLPTPARPPARHIWKFPVVSPCHIITQRIELVFAALLQIKPGRMLDCSAFAFVSRLLDVKQLDGPSGHLLVSQNLMSISSFVCVKTLESHFLRSQLLNAVGWSTLVRQITIPGSFSNQQACLPCLNTLFSILTSSLTNYTLGYKISHPLYGVLCGFD